MIRLFKQKAAAFVHLFLMETDEKEPFKMVPFIAMVLLMLTFVACIIYIAIISHRI